MKLLWHPSIFALPHPSSTISPNTIWILTFNLNCRAEYSPFLFFVRIFHPKGGYAGRHLEQDAAAIWMQSFHAFYWQICKYFLWGKGKMGHGRGEMATAVAFETTGKEKDTQQGFRKLCYSDRWCNYLFCLTKNSSKGTTLYLLALEIGGILFFKYDDIQK